MVEAELYDGKLRQDPPDLVLEVLPLPAAPEVVDHQEAAGQQVAPKSVDLFRRKGHPPDFEGVEEGKPADAGIVEDHRVLAGIDVEIDQSLEHDQELAIGLGKVHRPRSTPSIEATAVATVRHPGEVEFPGDPRFDLGRPFDTDEANRSAPGI
jgi:hypothetical protein